MFILPVYRRVATAQPGRGADMADVDEGAMQVDEGADTAGPPADGALWARALGS